jgi:SAM-dependent methyltransferase
VGELGAGEDLREGGAGCVTVETELKLNLGAGRYSVPGWTSVDIVPDFNPDIVCDITTLEGVEPDSVDSLFAGHVIEHLPDPVAALRRWHEVLKPNGDICIVCPDHAATVELWMNAQPFPVLTDNPLVGLLAVATGFYGWNNYNEMKTSNPTMAQAQQHRRALDLPVLKALMELAGFTSLEQIDESMSEAAPKFTQRVTWQMCVRGRKPEAIYHPV